MSNYIMQYNVVKDSWTVLELQNSQMSIEKGGQDRKWLKETRECKRQRCNKVI